MRSLQNKSNTADEPPKRLDEAEELPKKFDAAKFQRGSMQMRSLQKHIQHSWWVSEETRWSWGASKEIRCSWVSKRFNADKASSKAHPKTADEPPKRLDEAEELQTSSMQLRGFRIDPTRRINLKRDSMKLRSWPGGSISREVWCSWGATK